jgi:histidinol-phosphate aminotransferase
MVPHLQSARTAYRDVPLYAVDRDPCAIDLSDNTNLWGMPPAAAAAAAAAATVATRYPGVYAGELKAALAGYLGVEPDMIVTGCGSDDILDSAFRAFADPGERVAYPDPTFPMVPTFARMNALVPTPIPMTTEWDVDAKAIVATNARIMYLCSPNNPTGRSLSRAAIVHIAAEAPGIVIIDEAYAEFADRSDIDLLARSDRLVIARTMSKAFGLAGLRVGYAVGAPALVTEIEKSRGPYKVNRVAEHAAIVALTQDRQWVAEHVALVRENRERLRRAIPNALASDANFVFVRTADAPAIARRLRTRGVAVRAFHVGFRVTVGPWEMMEACLAALHE